MTLTALDPGTPLSFSFDNYTANLLRSLHNIMLHQQAVQWNDLDCMDTIIDQVRLATVFRPVVQPLVQLVAGLNASKVPRLHSSSAMMILHSIINHESKYAAKIIQTLDIQCLLDYCSK